MLVSELIEKLEQFSATSPVILCGEIGYIPDSNYEKHARIPHLYFDPTTNIVNIGTFSDCEDIEDQVKAQLRRSNGTEE